MTTRPSDPDGWYAPDEFAPPLTPYGEALAENARLQAERDKWHGDAVTQMRRADEAYSNLTDADAEIARLTAINADLLKVNLSHAEALARLTADEWRTKAAVDVLAERARQIAAENWTAEHDDKEHDLEQLADAAVCYIKPVLVDEYWPWSSEWWKPKKRRRNLVRAAALILAEIERLDRIPSPPPRPAP